MDQITATNPNWVVEVTSPSIENVRKAEVEQLRSEMETEEQPLPENLVVASPLKVEKEEIRIEQEGLVTEENSLMEVSSSAGEQLDDHETEVSFDKTQPLIITQDEQAEMEQISASKEAEREKKHSTFQEDGLHCDEKGEMKSEPEVEPECHSFQEEDSDHQVQEESELEKVEKPTQEEEKTPENPTVEDQKTHVPEQEVEITQGETEMEANEALPQISSGAEGELFNLSTEIEETPEPVKEEENDQELCEDLPIASDTDPVEEAIFSTSLSHNESAGPTVNPGDIEISSPAPPTQLQVSSTSPSSRVDNTPPGDMLHHIKNIQFKDKKVGIVTQNENGPCPLVAIVNVLLLRRQVTLPPHSEIVSAAKLMEYIGHAMLESVPKNLTSEVQLNYEQNMNDAMAVLPKLQTGLDVNVKFTGVRDFEYTPECIIFDLLRIPLFHGWLVDPQTPEVVAAVGQAGYNQLVEKVISQKCSSNEDAVTEALVIENFLERSASQLTYHGLSELTTSMEEDEIGVLFRNNHFSTIYKHQKELMQLVTDQGFLGESNVVWETLGSIDGDGQFVDSHFRTVPPKPELAPSGGSGSPNTSATLTAEQQIDHDFLVALSLQEEQQQEQPAAAVQEEMIGDVGEDVAKTLAEDEKTTQELMDLELARQLQEEEERQAAAEVETAEREATGASPPPPPAAGSRSPPQPTKNKKDNCTFL